MPPECPPKDFSLAEEGRTKQPATKGTLQLMSPCGAKLFITEMVQSESLSQLFKVFNDVMPHIAEELLKIHQGKMEAWEGKAVNQKTGRTGDIHNRHYLLLPL